MNNHNSSKKKSSVLNFLPEDSVTLMPFLGIHPIIYVPLCFFIASIVTLFILFIFIFHPSTSSIYISSAPTNAAVYIDNLYLGATPLKTRIENIPHNIRIEKLGFKQKGTIQYNKRNLFSNIIRYKINETLILQDKKSILENTISRIAAYVNTISTRKYIVPTVLNNVIEELLPLLETYNTENINKEYSSKIVTPSETIYTLLLQLVYFSLPYLQDKTLYQNNIEHIIQNYPALKTAVIQKNPSSDIQSIQNISIQEMLAMIEYYITHSISDFVATPQSNNKNTTNNTTQSIIQILDKEFIFIPYGKIEYTLQSYLEYQDIYQQSKSTKDNTNHQVLELKNAIKNNSYDILSIPNGNFYIQSTKVTVQQYVEFLQNNPHWQNNSAHKLNAEHSDNQLTLSNYRSYEASSPVTHITWYDANAYVQWFNTLLEEKGIQYRAKIPNEFEWRLAQQYIGSNYSTKINNTIIENSILSLYDDIWEWTDSWYSPLPQYSINYMPVLGREKIVLGGNYSNNITTHNDLESFLSRNNAISPDWASEYTSFRIILIAL